MVIFQEYTQEYKNKVKRFVKASVERVFAIRAKFLKDIDRLEQEYELFYIAIDKSFVVGTIGIKDEETFAMIARMYVRETYKGQGIGSQLLKYALDYCKTKNFKSVILTTDRKMGSIEFFEKRGFKIYRENENGKVWLRLYLTPEVSTDEINSKTTNETDSKTADENETKTEIKTQTKTIQHLDQTSQEHTSV
jgi:N-acetylglutamate synthase-like GNAT family acetyltransferase